MSNPIFASNKDSYTTLQGRWQIVMCYVCRAGTEWSDRCAKGSGFECEYFEITNFEF